MPWKLDFYQEEDGTCPAEEFLDSLPDRHVGKVLQVIQLLEEWGSNLPFPAFLKHTEQIPEREKRVALQHMMMDEQNKIRKGGRK